MFTPVGLPSDLYLGLEGALSNLTPAEREEAWLTVRDVLLSEAAFDAQYLEFCTKVSDRLQTRAKLALRNAPPRGVIK